jgi:hypothetical protein
MDDADRDATGAVSDRPRVGDVLGLDERPPYDLEAT